MDAEKMDWTLLIDPMALALVGIGSLLIAWVQNGFPALRDTAIGLWQLPASRRDADRSRLAALVVEDIVERRGVACADRGPHNCVFTRRLATLMSDEHAFAPFAEGVSNILEQGVEHRKRMVRVLNDIADAAPALGMLGTVVGLVQMFAMMRSASGIGLAMALCLLTSLYGLALSHLIAGPLARRLELVAQKETAWQQEIAKRLLALARREYPDGADRGDVVELHPVRTREALAS